jgi:hypothetical protein
MESALRRIADVAIVHGTLRRAGGMPQTVSIRLTVNEYADRKGDQRLGERTRKPEERKIGRVDVLPLDLTP